MCDDELLDEYGLSKISEVVRTRRLIIMGDEREELATIGVSDGIVELRIGGGPAAFPCEATVYAGDTDGIFSAGVELWAHGDSVRGCTLTVTGNRVDTHRFG